MALGSSSGADESNDDDEDSGSYTHSMSSSGDSDSSRAPVEVDIIAISQEWAGEDDFGDTSVATPASRRHRAPQRHFEISGVIASAEMELTQKSLEGQRFSSKTAFQVTTGVLIFLAMNSRMALVGQTIPYLYFGVSSWDAGVDCEAPKFVVFRPIYIVFVMLNVFFCMFQIACVLRDRELSRSRARLWRRGAYASWFVVTASSILLLGVFSGWQLLRSFRQWKNPKYRDSFLVELTDPSLVDDSIDLMPMFSSHMIYIFEWPFVGYEANTFFQFRLRQCDYMFLGSWVLNMLLLIMAVVSFDHSVSRALQRKHGVTCRHLAYRTCELISRVTVAASSMLMRTKDFYSTMFHVLIGTDWMVCFVAVCFVSTSVSVKGFFVSWILVGPNIALFVDEPGCVGAARRLTLFLDFTRVLELMLASWLFYQQMRAIQDPRIQERPQDYQSGDFWEGRLAAGWATMVCCWAACGGMRACSSLFKAEAEAEQPLGSQGGKKGPTPAAAEPLRTTSADSVFGLAVDRAYSTKGHKDHNDLASYIFARGIGDQFVSLLEILWEPRGKLQLSRLEIVEQLGEGGFGRVFKVMDGQQGDVYALKLQRKSRSSASAVREAEALHRLRHLFVVQMVRVFHTEAFYCILMELCEMDLNSRILKHSSSSSSGLVEGLPLEQAKHYAACIALALDYMHGRRFVFRDVKPENVLTTTPALAWPAGHAKLADFGLARKIALPQDSNEEAELVSGWTGTPAFMPPNSGRLDVEDPRQFASSLTSRDWYAAGLTLLLMLVGERGGRLVHFGQHGRAVLLPPPPDELEAVLEREVARGCCPCAISIIRSLTMLGTHEPVGIDLLRGSPFMTEPVAAAEQLVQRTSFRRR